MSALLLVSLAIFILGLLSAWSVKARSRWAGNGVLLWVLGVMVWAWLLLATSSSDVNGGGESMWLTFGMAQLVVIAVGVATIRWMGRAIPGVDGRGWFHLSTVIAATELLSVGAGAFTLVLYSLHHLGEGSDDARIAGLVLGMAGLFLWCATVISIARYLRDVRRARRRRPPERADAVIVLGAGLVEDQVSELLACRLERGMEAWQSVTARRSARSTPLIVSGGQGADELCTEAEAMKRYLVGRRFSRSAVVEEDRASDTTENLHFSLDLLARRGVRNPTVVVCTSDFHVLRTERIAEMLEWERGTQGLPFHAVVLGAPTPKPAIPASYIREYVALTLHRVFGRA